MSAGGARAPSDGAAVGGFTLTLPHSGLSVFYVAISCHISPRMVRSTFDRALQVAFFGGSAGADGGVGAEAPAWGAGVRSQMGADGSKNRNVSTFFEMPERTSPDRIVAV